MEKKKLAMGAVGVAAAGAAAMLMRPRRNRKVKKALRTVGEAVETVSKMIG